ARDLRARCILEQAREKQENEPKLIRLLEREEITPELADEARRLLCSRLTEREEHAAAVPFWEALYAEDGTDLEVAYGLVASLTQSEGWSRAAEVAFEAFPRERKQGPELTRVQGMLEMGLYCATVAKDVAGMKKLGRVWIENRRDDHACYERLLPAARTLRDVSGNDDALELLNRFAREVEEVSVAHRVALEIAWLEFTEGRMERAEKLVAAALRAGAKTPSLGDLLFALGEARFESEPALARAHYTNALENSGNVKVLTAARCLYNLGFEASNRQESLLAAQYFEELGTGERYKKSALRGEALTLAGEAAFLGGEPERATRLLTLQREQFPRHQTASRALFRLAQSAMAVEEFSEVDGALRELARVAPDFEPAVECDFMRGLALARLKKPGEARRALRRVIETDVASGLFAARARLELGQLAEAEGDEEAALSEYLKVALLFGGDAEACEALVRAGDVLQARGDAEAARDRWQECIARGSKKSRSDEPKPDAERTAVWVGAARERLAE
ncbi:MAG: tetratricopeptide repeat protein, partial [Planctomycetota bacterium]